MLQRLPQILGRDLGAALLSACEDAGNSGNDNLLTGGSLVLIVIIIVVVILIRRGR